MAKNNIGLRNHRQPRMYQPVWEAIKASAPKVTATPEELSWLVLECHEGALARIRKAISKEKEKDKAWQNKEYYRLLFQETRRGDGMAELRVTLAGYKLGKLTAKLLSSKQNQQKPEDTQ